MPSPLSPESMLPYQKEYGCGKLAVELARYKNGHAMPFTGPIEVASSIFKAVHFDSMFPHDVVQSLRAVDIKVKESKLSVSNSEQIRELRLALETGLLPILYVGVGAGHWITLWGFDKPTQKFFVFDSSKAAESSRGPDGLNRYGFDIVLEMARRQVLAQRIGNFVGRYWPRFLAEPGTVIFA